MRGITTKPVLSGLRLTLPALLTLATVPDPSVARTDAPALPPGMVAAVEAATAPATRWEGPRSGPVAAPGKSIAVVAEDLRNGGILGVGQGIREAAAAIGWKLRIFDAGGTAGGREKALAGAKAASPDGVIVVGMDAHAVQVQLQKFRVPMVGWHVGPKAGPMVGGPIAFNVSTDPLDVARVTAQAAVVRSAGRAGVVIFTDSNFEIAIAKSSAMADVIRNCNQCTLLEVRDVAISRSAEAMPAVARELLSRYGERWTHALAINDIYFDYLAPELIKAGLAEKKIAMLSAGDGSQAALMRIQARAFQVGTVAEPLNLHGWQLIDELNRLFAGQRPSGYVVPVHLVTSENVDRDGGPQLMFDPDNDYRRVYRGIWRR